MDTKQQGEQIEHKPKKQAKYKKHYCFPRMSKKSKKCLIAASAGEKSQQRQKAKLFLGTTMLIACTKMNPLPPPRCSTWCRRRWRNWLRRSFGGRFGGQILATSRRWILVTIRKPFLSPARDTVVLTLFSNFRRCKWNVNTARSCSVDICTYGSWTGKMMFDGTTEQISCITQHEDYLHHSERSKRQIVPSSCRRIWEQVSQI